MKATRYVDIFMLSAKRTATLPPSRASRAISAAFDSAFKSEGTTSVTAKTP